MMKQIGTYTIEMNDRKLRLYLKIERVQGKINFDTSKAYHTHVTVNNYQIEDYLH